MDADERLARVAAELVVRIRDEDPEANGRWLAAVLPDPADWFRLVFVLGALVPDDRTWAELTAWASRPAPVVRTLVQPPPCGRTTRSDAGARRHRRAGELPCEPCRVAQADYDRRRKGRARADTVSALS